MEYIKLLIPFIVGILTTPVVEGIKSALLFQKKENLVMIELTDLINDISDSIDEVVNFLQNVVGCLYEYRYISAEQLYSPVEIDVIFLRDNFEDFYIRSPENSRAAIKKIFKGAEILKEHQKKIVENKRQSLDDLKTNKMRDLWVLYYEYLSSACGLKENIKGFMCNEKLAALDCNKSIEKECSERGADYFSFHDNFVHAKRLQEVLKRLPK